MRNALAASTLVEDEVSLSELDVLRHLIGALFQTNAIEAAIEEVEELVARYQEASKAFSQSERTEGRLCWMEVESLYYSARLHEVTCACSRCRGPIRTALPVHSDKAGSVCRTGVPRS